MSEAPVNTSPEPARPGRARKLKPASMLHLILSRPRLSTRLSRILGWVVFILVAVLPLGLAGGTMLYLHSSLWPADFSRRLSRSLRLDVSVSHVTDLRENWLQLRDITIRPDADLPWHLHADRGTYHPGDPSMLSLTDVQLRLDLDWWSNPEMIPEPGRFINNPSQATPPVIDLRVVTVLLSSAGYDETIQADIGTISLKQGLLKLKLVSSPTTPRTPNNEAPGRSQAQPRKLLTASLGYQHGVLVKQLTFQQTPPELIRTRLSQVLGKPWASAFVNLRGELTLQQPADGITWLLEGSGTFAPDLLEQSIGLSGLGGRYRVLLKHLSGSQGYLRQGVFEINLLSDNTLVPNCSVEALKGLQFLATATEPLVAASVYHLPFDRAGAIITVSATRVYINTLGKDNALISNSDDTILSLTPQQMTRQELLRRLLHLKTLWAQLRIS